VRTCHKFYVAVFIACATAQIANGSLIKITAIPQASADQAKNVSLSSDAPAGSAVIDWAHWGVSASLAADDRRADAVSGIISPATQVGNFNVSDFPSNLTRFTWTDGTPTSVQSSPTSVGISFFSGSATGIGFSVQTSALDTRPYELRFYSGAFSATDTVTATLTDGTSQSDNSLVTPANQSVNGEYLIDFQASQPGEILTVTTIDTANAGGGGNVILQAASLSSVPEPTGVGLLSLVFVGLGRRRVGRSTRAVNDR
jgi:hypothetical protein